MFFATWNGAKHYRRKWQENAEEEPTEEMAGKRCNKRQENGAKTL